MAAFGPLSPKTLNESLRAPTGQRLCRGLTHAVTVLPGATLATLDSPDPAKVPKCTVIEVHAITDHWAECDVDTPHPYS